MRGTLPRALAAAHQFCKFETIHLGHLHIEKDECEIMDEQQLQSFEAGPRGQYLHIVALQQGGQRKKIFRQIIDQQALDAR